MRKNLNPKRISEQGVKFLKYIQEECPLFTTKEIKETGRFKNWPDLLANLKRKELIIQLERGKYISSQGDINSFLIGTKLIEPSAIAYFSALNYYGLTEQISNIVYVQTLKQKKEKEVLNIRYKFITISKDKFFGFEKEWIRHYFYFITDMEKTIIDCFDLPEYAGGFSEAVKGFFLAHEKLDKEKFWQYLLQIGNNTVIKRIGYLSELLKLKGYEDFYLKAQKLLLPKYTLLNPLSLKKGKYLRRWRLLLNLTEEEIIAMTRAIV
ncbi:MAG: hypothetical protein ABH952_08295 [Candidatus Omnitrophota bacterium]